MQWWAPRLLSGLCEAHAGTKSAANAHAQLSVMQVDQYAEYRALWQRSTGLKWCLEERRM